MRVQVYWNLHQRKWSVKHGGRVISHEDSLTLEGCKFIVQPAGRAKVRRTGHKNVHAFASGEWTGSAPPVAVGVEVTYNPRRDDSFIIRISGEAIHEASRVTLTMNAGKPLVVAERANV